MSPERERDEAGRFIGRSSNDQFNDRLRAQAGLWTPQPPQRDEPEPDPAEDPAGDFNAQLRREAGLDSAEHQSDPASEGTAEPQAGHGGFDGGQHGTLTGSSSAPDEPDLNERIRRAAAVLQGM